MDVLRRRDGRAVLDELIADMHANAARLSELDGATGDGDHGVNMDKGFSRAGELLGPVQVGLCEGLTVLGQTLLTEIGGAMGPLYGSFFLAMGEVGTAEEPITGPTFARMISAGHVAVVEMGGAIPGDKTLIDALAPADEALAAAIAAGASFADALRAMAEAAALGAESTKEMVARVGRASRLGERSRGFIDAGAASSAVILGSLARSIAAHISPE
ncbi:MAG: dihydroxyacetone kinase subunit DhaL [Chloroflexota bacterium]